MPSKPPADNSRTVYLVGSLVVILLLGFSIARIVRKAPGANAADSVSTASPAAPEPASPAGDQAPQAAASLPPMTSARPGAAAAPPVEEREPLAAEVAHVPRTTPQQLLAMIEKNDVTIIDVRDKDSYLARHIPGALQIPLAYVQGEVPYLPRGKPIVTYCTWPSEESSAGAALRLEEAGIKNATALLGGLDEWQRRGYPIEAGLPK